MIRLFSKALSLTLAIVMSFLGVAQVFADSQKTYVSECCKSYGTATEKQRSGCCNH